MYLFVTSKTNIFPIPDLLLTSWARSLKNKILATNYDLFFTHWAKGHIKDLTLVLCDLDISNTKFKDKIKSLFSNPLEITKQNLQIYNHPEKILDRHSLLEKLYSVKLNTHKVYRADQADQIETFPLFLRYDNNHAGPISNLIETKDELKRVLATIENTNFLSIVEYKPTDKLCNYFKKYSYFIFSNHLIPRHLLFSKEWCVKKNAVLTPFCAHQEYLFLKANPHIDKVRSIVEASGVSYGRIDYSTANGKIETWEINTNPLSLEPLDEKDSLRSHNHSLFAAKYVDCLHQTEKMTPKQQQTFHQEITFLNCYMKEHDLKKHQSRNPTQQIKRILNNHHWKNSPLKPS